MDQCNTNLKHYFLTKFDFVEFGEKKDYSVRIAIYHFR